MPGMFRNMEAISKYKCPRCHYSTDDRRHFLRHLKKKTPCTSFYQDIPIPNIISSLTPEKEHKCPHCTKSFTLLTNMIRHKKIHTEAEAQTTKVTTTNNIIDNSHSHHNTTNHVTIESLSITVNLQPFGREDCSQIQNDTELLNKYVADGIAQAIPEIINAIFLNDDLPQNKNVKLGHDFHPPEMLVYKNNAETGKPDWERKPRADVLQKLVDKGANVLIQHNNNLFDAAEKTDEVREMHDWRSNRLSDIKNRKRGTATVKDAVLLKFMGKKEADQKRAT